MKTFVVTGCNGYIGSHMCYELKKAYPDCKIHGIDKVKKEHLKHLYDSFDHTDLSTDMIYLSPIDGNRVDAIFHFAAYVSVEEGEKNPWRYYHNNVVGSLRLIDAAMQKGVKNFIFSSTAAVYGESINPLFGHVKEIHPMNAVSVYGKSKQTIEEILKIIKTMNVVRLRYFNACGRNVEANLYEEHEPETHLIPLLAKNNKAVIYGNTWSTKDGTCVRDYVHVIDICHAHIKAYEYMKNQKLCNLALNIGTGQGHSVMEVIDVVNQLIHNGSMVIEHQDRRNGDVPYLVADTSLAEMIIGFKPKYTLNDIIESMKNG